MRMTTEDTTTTFDDAEPLGDVACRDDRLPSWTADDESQPYAAGVAVCRETDRDGNDWVYLHAQECEASVRVDLDAAGWLALRDLCTAAIRASEQA